MLTPTPTPTARLKARALELGFDAVGVAAVGPLEAQARYEAWLAAGRHGAMSWLANDKHRARRAEPERLVAGIRSVLCVALCHPPAADAARDARLGRIARYALGEDYHRLMKDMLGTLERWIRTELFPGSGSLWYSDTGAILERGWAERAGLGWIGKHSGLLSASLGSYFVLGEVLMDRELANKERLRIVAIAKHHPEVQDVHDLRTRSAGLTKFIQLHIELDPSLSLTRAHAIGDEVEAEIQKEFPDAEIILHVDPFGVEERRARFA